MSRDMFIPAKAALKRLTIKQQTLYAYVSRGLVRAIPDPADSRRSLYSRHDIEALVARKTKPRRRSEIASGAIAWGEPVLESGISTIRDGDLYFGNRRAVQLCETETLETVSQRHWLTAYDLPNSSVNTLPIGSNAKLRSFLCLAGLAATASPIVGRTRKALARDAGHVLSSFANAAIGAAHTGLIHMRLSDAWALDASGTDLVRRALVLISDHELNASTFAVRVAASTGTSLPAAALAGLATLNGPLHGEATSRALHFLRDALDNRKTLSDTINRHADAKGHIHGLGHHHIYPDGDPRAQALLERLPATSKVRLCVNEIAKMVGHAPNVDMAFAAITLQFGLPDEAPFTLFAIGRLSGWLAHAIEQTEFGTLIRPRARFIDRQISAQKPNPF